MPQPSYFLQDDFVLTFGEIGNPLAANTSIHTINYSTRLLYWNQNLLAGWFHLDATASSAGQVSGGMWTLVFDTGTFSITPSPASGTPLWSGTVDHLTITGYVDPNARFAAAGYPRPTYETEPTEFTAVAEGKFTRTSGTWTDPQLLLDWVGSYNWNYDASTPQESTIIIGNMQARLVVPEPAGVVALLCGLVGLIGLKARKRR